MTAPKGIPEDQIQGYLDGFEAATKIACSFRTHVTTPPGVGGEDFNAGIDHGLAGMRQIMRMSNQKMKDSVK